ncbi:MAG: hypothetical protein ACLT9S_15870 [Faecalibacterium sp.]
MSVYRNDKASCSGRAEHSTTCTITAKACRRCGSTPAAPQAALRRYRPRASAPTALTVAGSNYTLGSSAVASTDLLPERRRRGRGGHPAAGHGQRGSRHAITGEEADSVFYGVVQTATRSLVEDNGADVLQKDLGRCAPTALPAAVNVDKSLNYPTGWLVEINVDSRRGAGDCHRVQIGQRHHQRRPPPRWATIALADDVQILDTTSEGLAGTVRPSRIAGTKLNALGRALLYAE